MMVRKNTVIKWVKLKLQENTVPEYGPKETKNLLDSFKRNNIAPARSVFDTALYFNCTGEREAFVWNASWQVSRQQERRVVVFYLYLPIT